jgi:glc operon protein GlcG
MYAIKLLGLAEAERAVKAMIEEASKNKVPMSVAVVDVCGTLLSAAKMDGAPPLTVQMAINKAYTAATFRNDTRAMKVHCKESGRNITSWYGDLKFTTIHGGVCVKLGDGTVVGAIGASGRSEDEDEALSFVGLKAIQNML